MRPRNGPPADPWTRKRPPKNKPGRENSSPEGDQEAKVKSIMTWYLRTRELKKAQTMTEYALILSAVAVVVFAGYQTMGNDITNLISTLDGLL